MVFGEEWGLGGVIKRVEILKIKGMCYHFLGFVRVSWGFCGGGVFLSEYQKLKSVISGVNCDDI